MIRRLKREKELKDAGLLANEIMGDYSTDISGRRITQGCFCGDCKWFLPVSMTKETYTIKGTCVNKLVEDKPRKGDVGHDCEHFKQRYHVKVKRKVS